MLVDQGYSVMDDSWCHWIVFPDDRRGVLADRNCPGGRFPNGQGQGEYEPKPVVCFLRYSTRNIPQVCCYDVRNPRQAIQQISTYSGRQGKMGMHQLRFPFFNYRDSPECGGDNIRSHSKEPCTRGGFSKGRQASNLHSGIQLVFW